MFVQRSDGCQLYRSDRHLGQAQDTAQETGVVIVFIFWLAGRPGWRLRVQGKHRLFGPAFRAMMMQYRGEDMDHEIRGHCDG